MARSGSRPLHRLACTAVLAVCGAAGCHDRGPRRHHVSGAVTFAGEPVPAGIIIFEPDAGRGNNGPQGFAVVREGRYDTAERYCKGTSGGPMVVRIDGVEFTGGDDAATAGRPLFPTHEARIDLPHSDSTHDFDVPKKSTP